MVSASPLRDNYIHTAVTAIPSSFFRSLQKVYSFAEHKILSIICSRRLEQPVVTKDRTRRWQRRCCARPARNTPEGHRRNLFCGDDGWKRRDDHVQFRLFTHLPEDVQGGEADIVVAAGEDHQKRNRAVAEVIP